MPYRNVDLDKANRNVLSQDTFTQDGGHGSVMGWLNTVTIENVHPYTTVAIRMNNLSGNAGDLKLYAYNDDGKLVEVPKEQWHIHREDGTIPTTLSPDTLYEIHVPVEDNGAYDLSTIKNEITISVVLGK